MPRSILSISERDAVDAVRGGGGRSPVGGKILQPFSLGTAALLSAVSVRFVPPSAPHLVNIICNFFLNSPDPTASPEFLSGRVFVVPRDWGKIPFAVVASGRQFPDQYYSLRHVRCSNNELLSPPPPPLGDRAKYLLIYVCLDKLYRPPLAIKGD